MNKTSKFTIILGIVSVLIITTMSTYLSTFKEDVQISQNILVGDESLVQGMNLNFLTIDKLTNSWQFKVPMDNVSESEVDFSFTGYNISEQTRETNFYINDSLTFSASSSGVMYLDADDDAYLTDNIIKVIRDVASRTELGETYTERIFLADYYDYMPLRFNISTKNNFYYSGSFLPKLIEYFKFPVSKTLELEITVTKNMQGIIAYSSKIVSDVEFITTQTFVDTDDGIIVAVQPYYEKITWDDEAYIYSSIVAEKLETQITKITWEDETHLEIEDIETLYSFDSSITIHSMVDLGENIGVLMSDDEKNIFSVRNKEDFSMVQEILLDYAVNVIVESDENFILYNYTNFIILTNTDGEFSVCLQGNLVDFKTEYGLSAFTYGINLFYLDGKFCIVKIFSDNSDVLFDILVEIYDETGVVYASIFEISQSNNFNNNTSHINLLQDVEISF